MSAAMDVLKQKRAALGTAAVARMLGYSQATIRSICSGNYPGDPGVVLRRVMAVFVNVVECPFAQREIPWQECRSRHTSPRPFGGSGRMAWWEACQGCPNRDQVSGNRDQG